MLPLTGILAKNKPGRYYVVQYKHKTKRQYLHVTTEFQSTTETGLLRWCYQKINSQEEQLVRLAIYNLVLLKPGFPV